MYGLQLQCALKSLDPCSLVKIFKALKDFFFQNIDGVNPNTI